MYASHTECAVMLVLYSEEYFIEFSNTVVSSVCDHYPRELFVRNVVRINHATPTEDSLIFFYKQFQFALYNKPERKH